MLFKSAMSLFWPRRLRARLGCDVVVVVVINDDDDSGRHRQFDCFKFCSVCYCCSSFFILLLKFFFFFLYLPRSLWLLLLLPLLSFSTSFALQIVIVIQKPRLLFALFVRYFLFLFFPFVPFCPSLNALFVVHSHLDVVCCFYFFFLVFVLFIFYRSLFPFVYTDQWYKESHHTVTQEILEFWVWTWLKF